ncbi:hypothetical protein CXG81DRAFT_15151, partial [Caulochytrium protostelioides]
METDDQTYRLNQLQHQVDTLKEDLLLEQQRVVTFQNISQAAEERLAEVNATYDHFRAEMEHAQQVAQSQLAAMTHEKDTTAERLAAAAQEVAALQTQIDAMAQQRQQADQLLREKEAALAERERAALETQHQARDDVRRQQREMLEAQSKYEREVVAHGETLQQSARLKARLATVEDQHTQSQRARKEAEASVAQLSAEVEVLKRQLSEHNADTERRLAVLREQNTILLDQLDSLSRQAMQIQAIRDGTAMETAMGDTPSGDAAATSHGSLQDVIRFLRKEKEMLQTQYNMTASEAEHLRHMNANIQKSLDETRAMLNEERQRTQASSRQVALEKELQDKIQQLSLLRESNVTLRDMADHANKQAAKYEKTAAQLRSDMTPLRGQIVTLQAELEARMLEQKALEEDNARWKNRT